MLRRIWKTIVTVTITIGVLLSFFVVIEFIRAYQVLYEADPVLGAVFAWLIVALLATTLVWYVLAILRRPPALHPPPPIDFETAPEADLREYARFQVRLMRRLATHERLSPEQRETLRSAAIDWLDRLAEKPDAATLRDAATRTNTDCIEPILAELDGAAEREVSRCVRDIMLAVTLSPWRTIDLLVVIYRNLGMVTRLTAVYNTRPPAREQLAILRDVLTVVATVNFLNYGSRLVQNLTTSVPILGRFTDDVAQGIGAGLLTSVAGHAAIDRCRAVQGWDREEAQRNIRAQLLDFMGDVKNVVTVDILQRIRKPVEAQMPEAARGPDVLTRLREGIGTAIDETGEAMDTFLLRPVAAAGRGVATTGGVLGKAAWHGSRMTVRGTAAGVGAAGRMVGKTVTGSGRLVAKVTVGSVRATGNAAGASYRGARRATSSVGRVLFRRRRKAKAEEAEEGPTQ